MLELFNDLGNLERDELHSLNLRRPCIYARHGEYLIFNHLLSENDIRHTRTDPSFR